MKQPMKVKGRLQNLLLGVLENDQTLPFLLSCKEMSTVKHTPITQIVSDSVGAL